MISVRLPVINKLFHYRILAGVACVGFALAFVIAGNVGARRSSSDSDDGTLNSEKAMSNPRKVAVPVFKATPQKAA